AGVQTCALPICPRGRQARVGRGPAAAGRGARRAGGRRAGPPGVDARLTPPTGGGTTARPPLDLYACDGVLPVVAPTFCGGRATTPHHVDSVAAEELCPDAPSDR